MTDPIRDQIVLITGASSGFGADAARMFAGAGAVVLLAARRVDRLTALAEQIRAAGGQAYVVPLDLGEYAQIEEAVQTILDQFGRIDILINNAGFGRLDWLENLDPLNDIQAQITVNLTGLIQLTRRVLPQMYQRRSGHIINMASVAGQIAAPLYTIYSATKYGVRGFTDALRREAAPFGVRVSGIYPGPAVTEFSQHSGDNVLKRRVKLPAFLALTSESVARRMLRLARHPRRAVILPGYYRLAFLIDRLFPGLVDWFLQVVVVRRFHSPEK
jgi:hypothetical protein